MIFQKKKEKKNLDDLFMTVGTILKYDFFRKIQ